MVEDGICDVCGRTKLTKATISYDLVCITCYGIIRRLHGLERTNKVNKIRKSNKIKLTMWE